MHQEADAARARDLAQRGDALVHAVSRAGIAQVEHGPPASALDLGRDGVRIGLVVTAVHAENVAAGAASHGGSDRGSGAGGNAKYDGPALIRHGAAGT